MRVKTLLACSSLIAASAMAVHADTPDARIALSNNYAGNSWRQAMLESWDKVTSQAVADGIVAEAPAFTTAENQATEQAAQIQNMILDGYDAIVINASSPTALNGAIKEACDAGIVVVTFDGIATEPCAWRVQIDYVELGRMQLDVMAEHFPDGGNLLEIRGLAGTSIDDGIHQGILNGIEQYPQFTIVGSVNGDWAGDVAQREVSGILPSLPDIVGVVTQGGDGYGAAQAFAAAGRDTPVIFMGNRQDELQWWKEQHDASGYTTESASVAPGLGTMAFWIAQQVLDGADPARDLMVPTLVVTQDTLDDALASTPSGGVANTEYSQQDAIDVISAAAGG